MVMTTTSRLWNRTGFTTLKTTSLVGVMAVLAGCGVTAEPGEPEDSPAAGQQPGPTQSSSTAQPSPELSTALLDTAAVNNARERHVELVESEHFSQYLTLDEGFGLNDQCAQLIDEINAYSLPATQMVSARYVVEQPQSDPTDTAEQNANDAGAEPQAEPSVETMIVESEYAADPLLFYREIAQVCPQVSTGGTAETLLSIDPLGDTQSDQAGSPEATEPGQDTDQLVDTVDAVRIVIERDNEPTETLVIGGATVEDTFHFYTVLSGVNSQTATDVLVQQQRQLAEYVDQLPAAESTP